MKKCVILALLLLTVFGAPALAEKGHVKLLAVAESSNGAMKGAIADLSLEIRQGKGRVFLETFPPTKEDTQISMRFAKQVACSYLEVDCSSKDFIYTIRAGPGIVGGPSAGAAAAVLTVSILSDLFLHDDVAITGTINSGGIIGTVGGLKSKITAAAKSRTKTALIPLGTRMVKQGLVVTIEGQNKTDAAQNSSEQKNVSTIEEDEDQDSESDNPVPSKNEPVPLIIANISVPKNRSAQNRSVNISRKVVADLDLLVFGKSIGVDVKEVGTLDDALVFFTGKNTSRPEVSFEIASDYIKKMENISSQLCERSVSLIEKAKSLDAKIKLNSTITEVRLNESLKFLNVSKDAQEKMDFYSAASYCFRSNINAGALVNMAENLSVEQVHKKVADLSSQVSKIQAGLDDQKINTITDLQATMVVLERLEEAKDILDGIKKAENGTDHSLALAYAEERLESIKAWSQFFGMASSAYMVSDEKLKAGCEDKIREAQERLEYVQYYLPNSLAGVKKNIDRASSLYNNQEFKRCLHVASLAKAEANLVSSVIGADAQSLPVLLDQKIAVAKRSIAKAQKLGYFPIAGYSYYEYAKNLKDSDVNSALLFAEYALELSNLEMYFDHSLANDPHAKGNDHSSDGPSEKSSEENSGGNELSGAVVAQLAKEKDSSSCGAVLSHAFLGGFVVGLVLMLAIAALSRGPVKNRSSERTL